MRRILSLSLIALLAVGAGACGSDSPTAPVPTIEQTTFAASLGYGDRAIVDGANGKVVVPKNSVLIYDITILRVRGR